MRQVMPVTVIVGAWSAANIASQDDAIVIGIPSCVTMELPSPSSSHTPSVLASGMKNGSDASAVSSRQKRSKRARWSRETSIAMVTAAGVEDRRRRCDGPASGWLFSRPSPIWC
ncbi:MAG TPA: hypothetical protein VIJ42_07645 [Stellaceae bacterium]